MTRHVVPTDQFLFRDPCERKHGGNENSVAAHEQASESKEQRYQEIVGHLQEIVGHLAVAGEAGMTAKELAHALGVQLNTVSGRFTELLATGRIVRLSIKREGSGVLVLARYRP